jgi:PAS domain S-box-containing protein
LTGDSRTYGIVVGIDRSIDVLCVDDEPAVAEQLAETLESADDRVRGLAETDPSVALDRVDGVDCVVSDYRMDGLTGLEVLQRVRERHPDLPFVLFTGEGSESIAAEAIAAGVTQYVPRGAGDWTDVLVERVLEAVESRRTRVELERARATQQALVEAAPVPMWVQGVEEIYVANDAAAALFGAADPSAIEGASALEFVPEADREAVREKNREMMINDGSATSLEGYLVGRDGVERYGLYATAAVRFDGRDALVVIARDITDRKEREETLRARNQRLEEFAAVVSHDIRTPLSTATAHVEQARDQAAGETPNLDAAAAAHERMDDITADLLELARQGRSVDDPQEVLLSVVADEARAAAYGDTGPTAGGTAAGVAPVEAERADLDAAAPGTPRLTVESDGPVPADPGRLVELLENLFVNADEHGAATRVRVGTIPGEDPEHGPVGFYVEDDGTGIPADERDRVFESGYTTSDAGTGFGLAIVSRVAEAHGWRVSLAEGRDGGARFEFRFGTIDPPD